MSGRPIIGVSSCLLGEPVRYNGGHAKEEWITSVLSNFVELIPICPEIEMGLGVPRKPIRIIGHKNVVTLEQIETKKDISELANKIFKNILPHQNFNGFILMSKSPSCGVNNAKLFNATTESFTKYTQGFFTSFLNTQLPLMPIVSSSKINDKQSRDHFLRILFAHFHFSELDGNLEKLKLFHQKYEFILNEHTEKQLGTIIQNPNRYNATTIYENYFSNFIQALRESPTKHKRVKSFKVIYTKFKDKLTYLDKKYFKYIINSYRSGKTSYIDIMSELQRMDNKYKLEIDKTYLFCPFPDDLSNS